MSDLATYLRDSKSRFSQYAGGDPEKIERAACALAENAKLTKQVEAARVLRSQMTPQPEGPSYAFRASYSSVADFDRDFAADPDSAQGSGPDWTEDAAHENGDYCCKCSVCGIQFTGHKRRVVCRQCASTPDPELHRLRAENEGLRSFVETIRDDFDCDSDAHRYGTFCRCCEAETLIGPKSAALTSQPPKEAR